MATIWKIAPGQNADNWEMCQEFGCIVIGWNELGDCERYKSKAEIVRALKREFGKGKGAGSGAARTIWRFVHEVKPGDIIVVNKGESRVVGIGVVTGPYLHPDHPKNPVPIPAEDDWWRRHARHVDWRVKDDVDLRRHYFFVASTITRLTVEQCGQIKSAYLRKLPSLKAKLNRLFEQELASNDQGVLAEDLREIEKRWLDATTKIALVNARIGQGRYRESVLGMWGSLCAVTKSATCDAIRASHIKPWRESTDQERLDPHNGLPLIANLDALFDGGLISFESSGRLVVSSKLTKVERRIFGILHGSLTKKPTARTAAYLAYHRANCFQK